VHGRYLRGDDQFHFAVWDGTTVRFDAVTMERSCEPAVVPVIFDRAGVEGPWLVHRNGKIASTISGESLQMPMPHGRTFSIELVRVSRDGHRVWAAMAPEWAAFVDLQSGAARSLPFKAIARLHLDPHPPLPAWNLFRIVVSLAKLPDGLAICGRKNRWRKVTLNGNGAIHIIELPKHERDHLMHTTNFGEVRKVHEHGCTLQTAQWSNRVTVWLDSRGLLHFKSPDGLVPEISLVLSDNEVAGWTSDGHACGPGFFFEGVQPSEAEQVFSRLLQMLTLL
jgi:hypothetical protein